MQKRPKVKSIPQLKTSRRRKSTSGGGVLKLGETMDISQAVDLRDRLLVMLEKRAPVVLDASTVQHIDTATMQVLVAFMCQARADKIMVSWARPSDGIRGVARLLGLSELLNLPSDTGTGSAITIGMEA